MLLAKAESAREEEVEEAAAVAKPTTVTNITTPHTHRRRRRCLSHCCRQTAYVVQNDQSLRLMYERINVLIPEISKSKLYVC